MGPIYVWNNSCYPLLWPITNKILTILKDFDCVVIYYVVTLDTLSSLEKDKNGDSFFLDLPETKQLKVLFSLYENEIEK